MTKRETRVINAFINCVKSGEFTAEYATVLIEDSQKYGWLSDEAKDEFYDALDAWEQEQEEEPEEEPAEELAEEEGNGE